MNTLDTLPAYTGPAYRAPTGFSRFRYTARQIIEHERSLGNKIHLPEGALEELGAISAVRLMWVTRERTDQYGTQKRVPIPEGTRILHEMPDGVLVLFPKWWFK